MDSKLQLALGRVIRAHRSRLHYSQESFAEAVGCHRTYMGAIERGEQNVALQNLEKIARALDLPLSAIFQQAEQVVAGGLL